MNISDLKNYIFEENKIEDILIDLGLHSIRNHGTYYTAANVDGDNPTAINVYINENLTTVNHTRKINGNNNSGDLLNLVQFVKGINCFEAMKYICDLIGLDLYSAVDNDIPLGVLFIHQLKEMSSDSSYEAEREYLKPIDESILNYYGRYVNDLFYEDNISYEVQNEFELGYDEVSNRITIPIRDEFGTLVGVKGRLFKKDLDSDESKYKYVYLEPCAKTHILYGLYMALPYIQKHNKVYVCESEKAVMQLWSYGIYNCVGIGGHKLSKSQVEKLSRLNVDIILCFDKDIPYKATNLNQDDLITECDKFLDILDIKIYYMLDKDNVLNKKESPTDNPEKFKHLQENNIYYYIK